MTRDTAAPHCLWSGQDQDKPAECQQNKCQRRWTEGWFIG